MEKTREKREYTLEMNQVAPKPMLTKIRTVINTVYSKTKKFYRWILNYWRIILYTVIAISLIAFIIGMIVLDRMQEIDAGMKYLLFPIYMLSAVIFGTSAKFLRDKKRIIIRRREIDSRWATSEEIKKRFSFVNFNEGIIDGAGIPIISDGHSSYVDSTESHSLIIGSTGSGKTRRIILPQISFLLHNNESIIVTDPKGELFEQTSGAFKKHGYSIITLNFRDPEKSNCWNPLAEPYRYFKNGQTDKAMEMINDIGLNIMNANSNDQKKDPFWEQSAVDYFIGLVLGLCEDAQPDQITLNNVNYMNTYGQERYGASNYIKEYFLMKNKFSNAYICASGTIEAPAETRASIISVFQQKLRVFTSQDNLSQMLSHSDFIMEDIGRKKTVVYIIIQDEKRTYHPLATAFIRQCYEVLIDCASKNGGKLPVRTNFILDEFGNLPPIIDMTSIVSAARSRNIRLTLAIQSNKQLDSVYGESDAEVIKNNCNNLIFLYGRDLRTLKDISELCGNKEEQLDFNVFEEKPLITTSQLQHLNLGEAIIITKENYPYKAELPDYSSYLFPRIVPFEYKQRRYIELSHFDIQDYVKKKKNKEQLSKRYNSKEETKATYQSPTNFLAKDEVADEKDTLGEIGLTKTEPQDMLTQDGSIEDMCHLANTIHSLDDSETNEQRNLLLCEYYFNKAFDAYLNKDYESAEMLFTKVYYLDESYKGVKNNLAYMKRRGETKHFSVSILELLSGDIEEMDAFELINLSLCYICGVEVEKDFSQAFRLIRRIKRGIDSANKWWSNSDNCGESEMHLVTFLLKASGKVVGSSKEEIKNLFEVACNNGYELPENSIHLLMHGE